MALTINDLPQNDDLDRQAMWSISGGSRTGVQPFAFDLAASRAGRIVDYPPGFGLQGPSAVKARSTD